MTTWVVLIGICSLIAYASNRFSLQSISLSLVAALAALYALVPEAADPPDVAEAFSGFASEALVTIVALMVLGKALIVTGALQPVASLLSQALGRFPRAAFAAVLIGGFSLSGILNDTPVVVMLLPIVIGAAARAGGSPATMLMPMNYAVILGGMMTAIGTSTNLLVNGLSAANGGPSFDFFDFYLIALPAAAIGLIYLIVFAPWILRKGVAAPEKKDLEIFLSSLAVAADSKVANQFLYKFHRLAGSQIKLRHLVRGGREVTRFPSVRLQAGDTLILAGTAADLSQLADNIGLEQAGDSSPTQAELNVEDKLISRQCVVAASSPIVGSTVRGSYLESRFDVRVTGLSEAVTLEQTRTPTDVRFIRVRAGDSLLIEGSEDGISQACQTLSLIAVGEPLRRRVTRDATLALVIFALVIAVAISKVVPISVAAVSGVLACVAGNVLNWDEIEQSVEWRIVLIVASSIALGSALVQSGAMSLLAGQLTLVAAHWPLPITIAALLTLSGLLTNFVSNNAAAAIMTPLALELARLLGAPLEPFVLAVLFGANMCFLTPMAYQTNLLVMSAAGYRFTDFAKVGLPLFVLLVPALTASLAWWYL